jgi:hypothetical protein
MAYNKQHSSISELANQIPVEVILGSFGNWKSQQQPAQNGLAVISWTIELGDWQPELCVLKNVETGEEFPEIIYMNFEGGPGHLSKFELIKDVVCDGDYGAATSFVRAKTHGSNMQLQELHSSIRSFDPEQTPFTSSRERFLDLVAEQKLKLKASEIARRQIAEDKFESDGSLPEPIDLANWLSEPDEPTSYRIEGLWPSGGGVLLVAQFKTGKTTMVMNVAKALADGNDFLGRFPVINVERNIGYLNFELSPSQCKRWLRRLSLENPEKLRVWNFRGENSPFQTDISRERFSRTLQENQIDVLIIDPFSGAFRGGNSNDNDEVKSFLLDLDRLLGLAGVKEVLIAAHAGHDLNGELRARGASTLGDHPDALWYIKKKSNKSRTFRAEGRDVSVDEEGLSLGTDSITLSLNGLGAGDLALEAVKPSVLKYVAAHPNSTASEIDAVVKGGNSLKPAARNALVDSGELVLILDGKTKRYTIP